MIERVENNMLLRRWALKACKSPEEEEECIEIDVIGVSTPIRPRGLQPNFFIYFRRAVAQLQTD